jgi:leucyl-tRNA synthetase
MELASKYDPQAVESKWYQYWLDNKLFSSKPDGREPYTVVIPPPNVTGVLHMGHMLNNTIQDILVRRARMEGKNACWVPGTDHASIATEAKVVNRLAQQGIKKTDLTREEFLKHAWNWTHEHGGIILKQLRKLGASCDWDRTAFTMDETRSRAVIHVFCDLYKKGLIYRGVRMVNWDPKAQTALSDEEVIYKDEHSKLYHLKYYVVEQDCQQVDEENVIHKDEKGYYAVVATTRPETIMGDSAMCINDEGQVVYRESEEAKTGKAGTASSEETLALGASKPKTATSVEKTWEQIKQQEKDGNERVLSGVPNSLPSLIKAYRIQDKARNVGFDWKEKEDVWDKVQEELEELKVELAKGDKENSTRELGDFIFSVINAARLYKLNPDNALEKTNQKFIRRFNYVEDHSLKKGKNLKDMSLEEMDKLWDEAKLQEKNDDK